MQKSELKNIYAIGRGYEQLNDLQKPKVKEEIQKVFNFQNRNSWFQILRGDRILRVHEAKAIEEIFAKYGVKSGVWGIAISKMKAHEPETNTPGAEGS